MTQTYVRLTADDRSEEIIRRLNSEDRKKTVERRTVIIWSVTVLACIIFGAANTKVSIPYDITEISCPGDGTVDVIYGNGGTATFQEYEIICSDRTEVVKSSIFGGLLEKKELHMTEYDLFNCGITDKVPEEQ